MEKYEVIIKKLNSNHELPLVLEVDEAETTENIVIEAFVSEQKITSTNYSYFSAYQEFRDQLLQLGYGIKCNGSRINAVQSGMMGATDKIYLVEMGKQALMKDVVLIFDYADLSEFPNTEQQLAQFEQWCSSLSEKRS